MELQGNGSKPFPHRRLSTENEKKKYIVLPTRLWQYSNYFKENAHHDIHE